MRTEIPALFAVRGRVIAAPTSGIIPASLNLAVVLQDAREATPITTTRTAPDGRFIFEDVAPGAFTVRIISPLEVANPWEQQFTAVGVIVPRDEDLGDILFRWDDLPPPSDLERYPDCAIVRVFAVQDGAPAPGLRVIATEEQTGLQRRERGRKVDGYKTVLWRAEYGALRLHLEDRDGNQVGACAGATRYPIGEVSEVVIEVSLGSLDLHLPEDFVLEEGLVLQFLLESSDHPPGAGPSASIKARGRGRTEQGSVCDARFPKLMAGEYEVRTIVLKQFEGSGWRGLGEGPRGDVTVVAGETAVLRL